METKYKLDSNGKIADDDPIYQNLEMRHENDNYDKILKIIQSIPRKQWSHHLWFHYISALNNLKRFDEARAELRKISEFCKTPQDKATAAYMLAYIFFMEDQELRALTLYKEAMRLDAERDCTGNCLDCENYIRKHFRKLVQTVSVIEQFFKEREQAAETAEKTELPPEKQIMLLSFLPSIHRLPVVKEPLLTEDLFSEYPPEEKDVVRQYLLETYKITNLSTLQKASEHYFHVNNFYNDILAYTLGQPNFDPATLENDGQLAWNGSLRFIEQIIEYIPAGGLMAWDMSERIGLARHAYACDLISRAELQSIINEHTSQIFKNYNSWSEYLLAVVLGGGYFLFLEDLNIKSSTDFVSLIGKTLLNAKILWNTPWQPF